MARTLTGCVPSPLDESELRVEFTIAAGPQVSVGLTSLHQIRNHRDRSCLSDHDEDLIFFLLLGGQGQVEHYDSRIRLAPGDGMLARFDRTLDTRWPDADLMLLRLPREALAGRQPDRLLGQLQPGSTTLMRLLKSYARTAWEEAVRTGELAPIADRHLAELLAAICAAHAGETPTTAAAAVGAARLAAMRERVAHRYADPGLTMKQVAASVGLSERSGHLAFERDGASFTEELQAVRLEHARERLRAARADRVADIGFAVGFSDVSHFYRLFKRRFGCTPNEMRRA